MDLQRRFATHVFRTNLQICYTWSIFVATISLQAYWERLLALEARTCGCKQLNSGRPCDKNRRQHVTLTNLLQIRAMLLQVFESLSKACNALQHCKYRKKSSATGCYTRTIFRATPNHCKSALQMDQRSTTLRNMKQQNWKTYRWSVWFLQLRTVWEQGTRFSYTRFSYTWEGKDKILLSTLDPHSMLRQYIKPRPNGCNIVGSCCNMLSRVGQTNATYCATWLHDVAPTCCIRVRKTVDVGWKILNEQIFHCYHMVATMVEYIFSTIGAITWKQIP